MAATLPKLDPYTMSMVLGGGPPDDPQMIHIEDRIAGVARLQVQARDAARRFTQRSFVEVGLNCVGSVGPAVALRDLEWCPCMQRRMPYVFIADLHLGFAGCKACWAHVLADRGEFGFDRRGGCSFCTTPSVRTGLRLTTTSTGAVVYLMQTCSACDEVLQNKARLAADHWPDSYFTYSGEVHDPTWDDFYTTWNPEEMPT